MSCAANYHQVLMYGWRQQVRSALVSSRFRTMTAALYTPGSYHTLHSLCSLYDQPFHQGSTYVYMALHNSAGLSLTSLLYTDHTISSCSRFNCQFRTMLGTKHIHQDWVWWSSWFQCDKRFMLIALRQRSRTRSTSPPNKNRPSCRRLPAVTRTNIVLCLHVAPPLTLKMNGTTDLHWELSSDLVPCHLQRQQFPERTLEHCWISRAM